MSKRAVLPLSLIFLAASCMLIQTFRADVVDAANVTAEEMLPAFLSDVIGLDLSKYHKTNEGYSTSYPPEFGGLIKREQLGFTLESGDSTIPVAAMFDNGFIRWIYFYPLSGSMIYAKQPSTFALDESRSILQRYQTFCQEYGLDASHVVSFLKMANSLADSPPAKTYLGIINNMTDFPSANMTSGNMKLIVSETSIWLDYTIDGVDIPNKSVGMNLGYNTFTFSDTWNLYSIGSLSVISQDEATSIAFTAAKNYFATLQIKTSDGSILTEPEWSQRLDVGLGMIPGQIRNDSASSDLQDINMGNTTRNPLALYPIWQAIFYFSKPIGNIDGIQVGVWGDTKETAYCNPTGFLGCSGQVPTGDSEQLPMSTPDNSGQSSNININNSALFIANRSNHRHGAGGNNSHNTISHSHKEKKEDRTTSPIFYSPLYRGGISFSTH